MDGGRWTAIVSPATVSVDKLTVIRVTTELLLLGIDARRQPKTDCSQRPRLSQL